MQVTYHWATHSKLKPLALAKIGSEALTSCYPTMIRSLARITTWQKFLVAFTSMYNTCKLSIGLGMNCSDYKIFQEGRRRRRSSIQYTASSCVNLCQIAISLNMLLAPCYHFYSFLSLFSTLVWLKHPFQWKISPTAVFQCKCISIQFWDIRSFCPLGHKFIFGNTRTF